MAQRERIWRKLKKGFMLIELLTVIFILSSIVLLLIPNLRWSVYKTQLTGCQMNLKQISNALQLYANDNEDYYPDQLSKLEPDYYKAIPLCPAVSLDTYSAGYEVETGFKNYTQFCKGRNHTEVGLDEDEPYWNLTEGLMPK